MCCCKQHYKEQTWLLSASKVSLSACLSVPLSLSVTVSVCLFLSPPNYSCPSVCLPACLSGFVFVSIYPPPPPPPPPPFLCYHFCLLVSFSFPSFLSICLSLSLSLSLSLFLPLYLPVSVSLCVSLCLSLLWFLSVRVFFLPSIPVSLHVSLPPLPPFPVFLSLSLCLTVWKNCWEKQCKT